MKNKKGEIATLLTLGLVVVGTLITLGTSLFVSNKKTNLASSSMAACPKGVAITNSTYFKCAAGCGKTSGGSCPNYEHNSLDASCGYCGTSGTTLPECTFKGTLLANTECGSSSNVTSSGCRKTSTGAQTYKCKTEPAAQPAAPASSGVDCGMTVAFAIQDCANGIDTTGCKSGTAKCKPLVAAAPAGTIYNCSEHGGGTAYQGVGCYELCSKKGSKYVPNSQGIGADGNNYCCCGGGLPGVDGYPADDSCWLIKCSGGEPTKMQYTDSLSKHDMPLSSCNDNMYSGGGKAAIGNANADAIFNTLSCGGSEETFTEPEPEIPDVPAGDDIPSGEEVDNCIKRVGFKCSSAGYTGSTQTFDYYKSTAKGCESNTVGGSCYGTSSTSCSGEWNAFLKSQCDAVVNPADQITCDHLTCGIGQTGDYYRRKISGTYNYYSTEPNCKGNLNGTTNLTTIKNNQCKGGGTNDSATDQGGDSQNGAVVTDACKNFPTGTCIDYCGKNKWYYSNRKTYVIKNNLEFYPDTCTVIPGLYTYCQCSSTDGPGLTTSDMIQSGVDAQGLDVQTYNCKSVGTFISKPQAINSCSFCGGGLNYYNKPYCVVNKIQQGEFQTSCCINELN